MDQSKIQNITFFTNNTHKQSPCLSWKTILSSILLSLFFVQCAKESDYYEKCKKAEQDYLVCSLAVYSSYTYCAEGANSASDKTAAKVSCDASRIVGLYYCEQNKKEICGGK
jgi:hypothetical protein